MSAGLLPNRSFLVLFSTHSIILIYVLQKILFSGFLIKIAQTPPIFACIANGAKNGSCYMSNSVLQNQVQYLFCCVHLFVLSLSCLCSVKVVSPLFCQNQKVVLFCCVSCSVKSKSPKSNAQKLIIVHLHKPIITKFQITLALVLVVLVVTGFCLNFYKNSLIYFTVHSFKN